MFELIDTYTGLLLDTDLAGLPRYKTFIVESNRRLIREMSYGYVHALWWVRMEDGRSVMSVRPGAKDGIATVLREKGNEQVIWNEELGERLKTPINAVLQQKGLLPVNRTITNKVFACNGELLCSHPIPECRRLTDAALGRAEGIYVPDECLAKGTAFGFIQDGLIVSVAYAHQSGIMTDQVADIGVETTSRCRRKGFAKAAVSALVADFTSRGGEARYGCHPDNTASMATARCVGFVPYAESFILSAPSCE